MAKITRATQQLFATTGLTPTGGFAAAANGVVTTEAGSSNSVSNIQTGQSGAWAAGLLAAVLGGSKFPAVEDLNGVLNVITTQLAYLFQQGIPEYDAGTTYYTDSLCIESGTTQIYKSLTDANIGNALSNGTYWELLGDLANLSGNTVPINHITGTSHTVASTDSASYTTRSNSGTGMTDTLPGTSGALADGEWGYYKNTDATASITLAVGSGGTINQGNLTGSAIILPGETWFWESAGSAVYNVSRISSAVLHAAPPQGSFQNLKGSYLTGTTAGYTAGSIVVQDSNGNTRKISAYSQTVNSATSGAGGLSTGSIAANTWYGVWALFDPTTNAQSIIMDPSFTSPTLPSGYPYSALIGALITDGSSHFINFIQYGKDVQFPTPFEVASGSASFPTAVAIGAYVPTAIASRIRGYVQSTSNGVASYVGPNSSYFLAQVGNGTGVQGAGFFDFVIESTNIYYGGSNTGAAAYVNGFSMNL